MSSTARLARHMRALAHIPLLTIEDQQSVLVTASVWATPRTRQHYTRRSGGRGGRLVSWHPGARGYFADVNLNVLDDPRVAGYVNDGRQHLQMQPASSYDLITLEPPPIARWRGRTVLARVLPVGSQPVEARRVSRQWLLATRCRPERRWR